MIANGIKGKIVFVSSVLGFMGLVGYSQYSPMKYAVRGMFKNYRLFRFGRVLAIGITALRNYSSLLLCGNYFITRS